MTADPDQLRREIESTQRGLSADVNALTEKVTPSRIVHRRVDRARSAITRMKDTIMGSASHTTSIAADRMSSATSSVADTTSSMASSAAQTVTEAPRAVRHAAAGNPLAAGLITFGLGWLTASLLPATQREHHMAEQAKDLAQDHVQPVVSDMAGELKENLREPARDAVDSVKSTAQEAGTTIADHTRTATQDITGQTRDAKDRVAQQASSANESS